MVLSIAFVLFISMDMYSNTRVTCKLHGLLFHTSNPRKEFIFKCNDFVNMHVVSGNIILACLSLPLFTWSNLVDIWKWGLIMYTKKYIWRCLKMFDAIFNHNNWKVHSWLKIKSHNELLVGTIIKTPKAEEQRKGINVTQDASSWRSTCFNSHFPCCHERSYISLPEKKKVLLAC